MFQYAFGKALAVKNNTQLILSTSYINSKLPFKKWASQMKYELHLFKIEADVETNLIHSKILYPFAKVEHLIRDKWNAKKWTLLQEASFEYHPAYLEYKDNIYVKGNFQSEKYFQHIKSILKNELIFKDDLKGMNVDWFDKINNTASVSIHIRRGDYISIPKNQDKFIIQSLDYYQQAVSYIANQVRQPVFFVFSDDMEWAKQHVKIDFPTYFVDNNNTPETHYIDMQLMSMCKHQIICNSTFSWWAAWLNNNPQKIIIAPQKWFADPSINSQDLIPSDWIKM